MANHLQASYQPFHRGSGLLQAWGAPARRAKASDSLLLLWNVLDGLQIKCKLAHRRLQCLSAVTGSFGAMGLKTANK